MRLIPTISCVLLLALPAQAAVSAWDETQLDLLSAYSTPLRWDNVEGPPWWVSGAKPHHHLRWSLDVFELQPGQEVTLRGAPNTWLRLTGKMRTLKPGDLEISVSTDARLFVESTPILAIDPYSLLVRLPGSGDCLTRLTRPRQATASVTFAAFFSREQPLATILPYRDTVHLPGKILSIRRDDPAGSTRARLVTPEEGTEFTIEGPARLQLEAFLPWPQGAQSGEQPLVIQVETDRNDPVPLLLAPALDARHRTRVNHQVELVSHRMQGFMVVREGKHVIRLQPTAAVYISVYRQSNPAFLLPWLNGPRSYRSDVSGRASDSPRTVFESRSALLASLAADLGALEQEAWLLASDNRWLDAAGQAADWLNRVGQTRRDYPPALETAQSLWKQRTFYREVLPARLPAGERLQKAFFSPGRLKGMFEPPRPVAVSNPTLDQVCDSLVEGNFAQVPPRLAPGLVYDLPPRAFQSSFRVAVASSSSAGSRLLIQFDQETPISITLDPKRALPPSEIALPEAFATLRVLETRAQLPANTLARLAPGEFDTSWPLMEAGVVELPMPQHVRQARIYLHEGSAPVLASVAYRAAKPFELGDGTYVGLVKQIGADEVLKRLADLNGQPTVHLLASAARGEIDNQLLPLKRLLKARYNDFIKSIDQVSQAAPERSSLSQAEIQAGRSAAQRFEREGHDLEALEFWNQLFWEAGAAARLEATLGVMRCLQALGEEYLASQYARYALLSSPGAEPPPAAVARLETDARDTDDREQQEQLQAFLFCRCPCARHGASLVEALALNGRDGQVLQVGLLLPSENRPLDVMLAAALRLNRWETFDALVKELNGQEATHFWKAQKQLAFCQFAEAERELEKSHELGRSMAVALKAGLQIRERLSSRSFAERFEALLAWEQWQLNQPGPKTWKPACDVEVETTATELVVNTEQNQFSVYYRAEPGKPVKLRFNGPVRLQVEARPVLGAPVEQPVDDWLEIAEFGITNRTPVLQCVPNPGLRFASGRHGLIGFKTIAEPTFGPGWHEVEISLADRPGLIYVLQEEPLLPLRVLPGLNARRASVVLKGEENPLQVHGGIPTSSKGPVWWVTPDMAASSRSSPLDAPPESGTPNQDTMVSDSSRSDRDAATERLRLALRLESAPGSLPGYEFGVLSALAPSEQWLAMCRAERWPEFTNWAAVPESTRVDAWLALGRVQRVLNSEVPRNPLQRLTTLLEIAERFSDWRELAQCHAELLASGTNFPSGGKRIMASLGRDRTWIPLPVSPMSAGVRPIEVVSDMPQDSSARLRRALLPPAATNQFTLSAQAVFTASMALKEPAQLKVRAEVARAGFSPLTALNVALQVDALEIQHLSLRPPKPETTASVNIPEGTHMVRMWMEDPVANQLVRISFSEDHGSTNAIWTQSLAQAATQKRFFHTAIPGQPLRFSWTGPAVLRVDEWRSSRRHEADAELTNHANVRLLALAATENGQLLSRLLWVPPGEQTVEVPADPGRAESSYQIFLRKSDTNQPGLRPTWATREPDEMPPPKLQLKDYAPSSQAQLTDEYRLGGQEDGTWTPGLLFAHRRPFELSPGQRNIENEFFEANVAYRKVNSPETAWFRTEVLARAHTQGDFTAGLGEQIEWQPQDSQYRLLWRGDGLAGTTGPGQKGVQWSLATVLELERRFELNRKQLLIPFVGLFGRYLSLDSVEAQNYDYVDQDLFSKFRDDHRWGWVAGGRWEYRPWLDTLLEAAAGLQSNEDFSPDNWGMRFSWTQLAGPMRAEAAYQFRWFLADSDRSSSSVLQGVSAAVYFEHWFNGRYRGDVGVQYRHDWPHSGDSWFVVLRLDMSHGRGYRDYSPREMVFREARSRRIPAVFNNTIESDSDGP